MRNDYNKEDATYLLNLGTNDSGYTLSVQRDHMGKVDIFKDKQLSGLVFKMATEEHILPKDTNTRISPGSGVDGATIGAFRNMYKEAVKTQKLKQNTGNFD